MPQPRCFKIHPGDNVATLLDDVTAVGAVRILGHSDLSTISATEPIKLGHKIALVAIPQGEPVVKFGVAIGRASRDIAAGQWVHLHNCTSGFDQRSQTLDVHTGAATDTKYE
jgi:hypothetical protein